MNRTNPKAIPAIATIARIFQLGSEGRFTTVPVLSCPIAGESSIASSVPSRSQKRFASEKMELHFGQRFISRLQGFATTHSGRLREIVTESKVDEDSESNYKLHRSGNKSNGRRQEAGGSKQKAEIRNREAAQRERGTITVFCLLPPATCLLPPAVCLLPPAFCPCQLLTALPALPRCPFATRRRVRLRRHQNCS